MERAHAFVVFEVYFGTVFDEETRDFESACLGRLMKGACSGLIEKVLIEFW